VIESTVLQAAEKPADVVQAAGRWLADQLGLADFGWRRSDCVLQRVIGERTEQIALRGATRNRAGRQMLVELLLVVRDGDLKRWRAAHPDVVLRDDDWLVGHPLGYVAGRANGYTYGSYEHGVLDLLDPARRVDVLTSIHAVIRDAIRPWFAETAAPESMLTAPSITLRTGGNSILEWLACHGRADLVEPMVDQILASQPGWREGYQQGWLMARDAQRPSVMEPAAQLGWSAVALTAR
jgi:hypothetical protein